MLYAVACSAGWLSLCKLTARWTRLGRNGECSVTNHSVDRRNFLSLAGKGLGLAALSSATVASLLKEIHAASKSIAHLTPAQAAIDEDFWFTIQNAFSVTRGIINLNNGGVSPRPRIRTQTLGRFTLQQERATPDRH